MESPEFAFAAEVSVMRLARMRHAVTSSRTAFLEQSVKGGFQYRLVFVTLTYRPGRAWSPGDLPKCLNSVRSW